MRTMPPYIFLRSRLFLWFIRPVIIAVLALIGALIGGVGMAWLLGVG